MQFPSLDVVGLSPEKVGAVREGFLAGLTLRLLPTGSHPGD
ncbi:hypothetical protein [Streptomyces sp. NPDC058086]